jgi:hypothetical protein
MTQSTTLIRVTTELRDRIRRVAEQDSATYGEVLARGLDLIERDRFWASIAAITPDQEYLDEFAAWDDAPLDREQG